MNMKSSSVPADPAVTNPSACVRPAIFPPSTVLLTLTVTSKFERLPPGTSSYHVEGYDQRLSDAD